ncbi:MAG: RNA polymerase Rpb4 family protein [Candidatus Micrarchaeota archaeon]|nr:RNA polymerase Rpb4 family protein [Candidatus Micrarchaeota archaeon]
MIGKEIKGMKAIPLCEVARMLEERQKEGELGFEQKATLDYAQKYSHVSVEKAHELMQKIMDLQFASEVMAVKLVDIMPKTEEEVKLIFQQEKRDITSAQAKQVLDILSAL